MGADGFIVSSACVGRRVGVLFIALQKTDD
jgi:hypothetical protein